MFVPTTTLRTPLGGTWKIAVCSADESVECSGKTRTRSGSPSAPLPPPPLEMRSTSLVISISPGMNTRIAPSGGVVAMRYSSSALMSS